MRLLVVDDDAVFREELAELLRDEGHEVAVAPSAPKALEALTEGEFEVVLTDLKMPRQSGLDLLRDVRQRWPRLLVVMITGYATVESAVEAMKLGAFDYLRKPFQLSQVRQVLGLIGEELKFRGGGDSLRDLDRLIGTFTGGDEPRQVLCVGERAGESPPHVTYAELDPANPFRLRERVIDFVAGHPRPAVIVEGAERLFVGHRRKDVVELLAGLRELMDGKGPLVVTFDPARMKAADAVDLRSAVVGPTTRSTLETLSNPIRRAVLRRASEGPTSFTEAMHAAGLDDSPKLSFHLRKLIEDGLLLHQGEQYRITPRGKDAVGLLAEMDAISSPSGSGNAVLTIPG